MTWIPLHVHSQYSILEASASVKDLAKKAASKGMSAIALTDAGNLYGAVEFFRACVGAKVKPIIGCQMYVAPESRLHKKKVPGQRHHYSLVLLAKNSEGYHNLCRLSSIGFLEGFYYDPRIDLEVLKQYSSGLVCLVGALGSRIADDILSNNQEGIDQQIAWFKEVFAEDLYFELQRQPMAEADLVADGIYQETWLVQKYHDYITRQEKINTALVALGKEHNIPVVATNATKYLEREDWRAHEILINIQSGEPCEIWEKDSQGNPKFRIPNPQRLTYATHELYFKSQEQMAELFADIPEAISNTQIVADKCALELDFKTKHYPVFVPPDMEGKEYTNEEREKGVEAFLWKLCEEGIGKRYTPERLAEVTLRYPGRDPMEVVRERLAYEMNVIVPKGMSDYLLIVWDFLDWAKKQGIPVGPGRGSGAGSIILYLIGVTDIEPLRFSLFFERFINPERISYPDIDVDICMDRRGDVINYTLEKYGHQNVAQIITFNTMKARSSIKDVGRVLNIPLTKVNAISKLVPDDLNITLETALEKDADLRQIYQEDEEAKRVIDIGMKLEGSIRNSGIHAAGIIICGEPLTNYIPICAAKDSDMPVTQYSMKPVEEVGMLKIDFLGLKTLTSIQLAVEAIKERTGREIDWVNLPLGDMPTFDLLNQGRTTTVFQLESGGMQDLARQLHLDRFEEIIAVGALYRPGPMDMIPSFINRKHGREPIEYDHPWLEEILDETYGIMVYQEQVMQIASKMASYSLGEGDVLRRAMGKKEADKMAEQREKFREGALKNGVEEKVSMAIFDKMEKFAAYGFNKSHATAYGYLSYVTGFLKANYPKEWLASLMTCDGDDLTKVSKYIREGQTMGIAILPPDVNEAGSTFMATDSGIRFAMAGIKGVGSGVVEVIVEERKKKGPFKSLYDFFKRLDMRKVGKKNIECLVDAGSFDFTGWSRDQLRESIEPMFDHVVKEREEAASGYMSLFAKLEDDDAKRFSTPPKVKEKRTLIQLLLREKELLGFFVTGHPLDESKDLLRRLSCVPLPKIHLLDHDSVFRAAFIVESVAVKISAKTQKKFAILTIGDGLECFELPIWSELYEEKKHLLADNQLLYAVLQADRREESLKLSCQWVDDLTRANDMMIHACDAAYDKAKAQAVRFSRGKKEKSGESKPKPKEPQQQQKKVAVAEKIPQCLIVGVDADKIRLTQIMEMRKIFEQHGGGNTNVRLEFKSGSRSVATLHLESFVIPGLALTDSLKMLDCQITTE
ncbi:MAG: DNA polymerase III subunit alpha [Chlamydiales bacterium]|nr:DNA polymerase III subunit alpha [Chlamydiales bacterium]